VQKQLERLFLVKWVWELKDHEENTFLAKFPSNVELQCAIAFGGVDLKGKGIHERERGSDLRFGMRRKPCIYFQRFGSGLLA
jgi:hypothetical protein